MIEQVATPKPHLLLLVLLLAVITASAQHSAVNGFLLDSITHLPIANGTITNIQTKKTVHTTSDGFFRLEASSNDMLYATAKGYRYDTLRYSLLFRDSILIYLPLSGYLLEEVTVNSGYGRYQLDSMTRRKQFEELRGQRLPALAKSHTSGFGLVINLDRFLKQKYKHKNREEQWFGQREKEAYIDFRFPPQLVALYTGLKGQELLSFMQRYRPGYDWLRRHPAREQMIDYMNDKLKAYKYGIH